MPQATPASEIRFAQLAVELKFCTPEQVSECIRIQRKQMKEFNENYSSLADIMVEKSYVARHQANQIIRDLQRAERRKKSQRQRSADSSLALDTANMAEAQVGSGLAEDFGQPPPKATPSTSGIAGYRIIEEIGDGRTGKVYKASQESMDRIVALKVLPPDVTDPAKVEHFLSEARAAGQFNHPNVIRVHDVGENNGQYYYSMEFVQGDRISDYVEKNGPLEPLHAVRLMIQVAQALEYGHRSHTVHGEVRPESIVMTGENRDQAKLEDLGLTTVDSSRFLMGNNASFVSPEHVSDAPIDTRSDLYSLGATFYYALTGELLFDGASAKEVLQHHISTEPEHILDQNGDVPEELGDVIMTLLEKAPEDRYQTPTELLTILNELQDDLINRKAEGPRRTKRKRVRGGRRPRRRRRRR